MRSIRLLALVLTAPFFINGCDATDKTSGPSSFSYADLAIAAKSVDLGTGASATPTNLRIIVRQGDVVLKKSEAQLSRSEGIGTANLRVRVLIPENGHQVELVAEKYHTGSAGEVVDWSGIAKAEIREGQEQSIELRMYRGPQENLSARNAKIGDLPDTLDIGQVAQLAATVENVENPVFHWASSDTSVLGFREDMQVEGRKTGVAHVIVTAGPAADTVTVVVRSRIARFEGVPQRIQLSSLGADTTLVVRMFDHQGQPIQDLPIQWSSENTGIASVDSAGKITAVSTGVANIKLSVESHETTIPVEVVQVPVVLNVMPFSLTLTPQKTGSFVAIALDAKGRMIPSTTPTWRVENPNIASVHTDGTATALAVGKTAIYAELGSLADTATLEVKPGAPAVIRVISGNEQSGRVGQELAQPIQVRVEDEHGFAVPGVQVHWSTTNGSVSVATSPSGSDGNAEVRWTLGTKAGEQKLIAKVDSVPELVLKATATADAPASIELMSGGSQSGDIQKTLADSVVFRVADRHGNAVPDVTVSWSATHGGIVSGDTRTSTEGRVAAEWKLGATPGTQTLTLSIGELAGSASATAHDVVPETPTLNVASVTNTGATLTSSAYVDGNGNAHKASQWQVDLAINDFSTPAFNSGADETNLISISVETLQDGENYKARVRYQDDSGSWSSWSAPVAFTTTAPPATPTASISSVSGTSADVEGSTFNDPDDHSHAASQWQVDAASGDFSNPMIDTGEDQSNLTRYTITSLNQGAQYKVRVRYRDNSGSWSHWSNAASLTTTAPPVTPTLTVIGSTAQSADLSSTAFTDPDGHTHSSSHWQVGEAGTNFATPIVDTGVDATNLLSLSVGGLSSGTSYEARVRHQDSSGEWSQWSLVVTFHTAAAPAKPSIVSAMVSNTSVSLSGSAFSDLNGDGHSASQWQVDVSSGDFTSPVFDSGVSSNDLLSVSVGFLSEATTYKARVRYQDATEAWSFWSDAHAFATTAAPQKPTLTATNVTASSVDLSGSAFSDPDGHSHAETQWQVDTSTGTFTTPVFDSGATPNDLTAIVVSSLANVTDYKARARYKDSTGVWSTWSDVVFFRTSTPPATPSVSVVLLLSNSAGFSTSGFSDQDGDAHLATQWQVDLAAGDFSTPVIDSGADTNNLTSLTVNGLSASTNYQVRARFQDGAGVWGSWSASAPFTTPAENLAPNASFTFSPTSPNTSTQVAFDGSGSTDSDGTITAYDWDFQNDGSVDAIGITTQYTFSTAGTYTVKLVVRDNGSARDSTTRQITVTAGSPPATPSMTVSNVTSSSADLSSSAFSDADGETHTASQWQVLPADTSGGAVPVYDSGTDATNLLAITATGLSAGTSYQARVRHQDSSGAWSSWSSPQPFSTSSAVASLTGPRGRGLVSFGSSEGKNPRGTHPPSGRIRTHPAVPNAAVDAANGRAATRAAAGPVT